MTVLEPLGRFNAYFPEVNDAIKRRQKKLLDYDAIRSKVSKLVDKPSEDPQRLPKVGIGAEILFWHIDFWEERCDCVHYSEKIVKTREKAWICKK